MATISDTKCIEYIQTNISCAVGNIVLLYTSHNIEILSAYRVDISIIY